MARGKKSEETTEVDIVEAINKEFGSGTLLSMSDRPTQSYEVFSTGSMNLDKALGIGGLPRGRIVEAFGSESSGKTTLALQTLASAMKAGYRCAFIDAEHALDMDYAKALGVDPSKLVITQPDNGEQALNICERLVQSKQFAAVVVDSVAALTPKSEIEGEVGDFHVGKQARMMSQALRKLVAIVNQSNTLLIFINQTRSKIGVTFGSPTTTPGGNALKFYASIRLQVTRTGSQKVGGEAVANATKVKVVKNKCATPFREALFDIEFGKGVSKAAEVIDAATEAGFITKSGAWYLLADGTKLGHGREKAKDALADDPKLMEELLAKL